MLEVKNGAFLSLSQLLPEKLHLAIKGSGSKIAHDISAAGAGSDGRA
jgi:hypothetical protein